MRLQKVGEKVIYLDEEYDILEVVTGTDNHVFYLIDYERDGDCWYVFVGVLVGEEIEPILS